MRRDLDPETLYPHEIPIMWAWDVVEVFVGVLVFAMIIVLTPIIMNGIIDAIPPEHGIIRLHRPKYSRFVKETWLKW
jgi:hypothetical protein